MHTCLHALVGVRPSPALAIDAGPLAAAGLLFAVTAAHAASAIRDALVEAAAAGGGNGGAMKSKLRL